MKLKSIICALLMTFTLGLIAQNDQIQWLSFEEAQEKMQQEKRKLIIDVYTDGCQWCKKMDMTTFKEDFIAQYINENFYPVKLNAEQRDRIVFGDKSYEFVSQGKRGYHELAAEITRGAQSFPCIVFIDEDMQRIQCLTGYKEPNLFERIVTYFAGDHYKSTPWSAYENRYQAATSASADN